MEKFLIRNFLCDYTLLPPNEYSLVETKEKVEVPVIHLFGPTTSGRKACVHIHGVHPYLILRVGGDMTERVKELICTKLTKLLHAELNKNKSAMEPQLSSNCSRYIQRIESFQAKSLYGLHTRLETFAKIYFNNPFHIVRVAAALGQLAEDSPIMQPFEAHVPPILQFFMDNSIFGMDWVHFRSVRFRIDVNRSDEEIVYNKLTIKNIKSRPELLSSLPPSTSCYLEADATVEEILNTRLHSKNVHSSNPGLEYIWKEEAERCRLQNRSLEDAFNHYSFRPYPEIRTEKIFLENLKKAVDKFQEWEKEEDLKENEKDTSFYNDGKDAEILWLKSQDLHCEGKVFWSDTNDFFTYALEEEWDSPDHKEEINEEDDVLEMTTLIEEADLSKTEIHDNEEKPKIGSGIDSNTFVQPRDITSPDQPQNQREGIWMKPRKKLVLKRRKFIHKKVVKANKQLPKPAVIHGTVRNKLLFGDDTVASKEFASSKKAEVISATDGRIEEVRDVSVASLELFILTDQKFPNTMNNNIIAASLCIADDACRNTLVAFHSVITTISAKIMASRNVIVVSDEINLIERIILLVNEFDPDILIGYDSERLSWGYLIRRAEILNCKDVVQRLGRYKNARSSCRKDVKMKLDGRLLESVWRIVRRDLNLRSYDRGTASIHILKKRFPVLNDALLSKRYIEMDAAAGRPIHYHIRRMAKLNIELLYSIDWFIRNAEMAKVYGIQFHEVWTRGSQLRVESMLLRLAHKLNYVAPSVTIEQRDKMCAPEQLQLIMEPESKVYHDPVIVLDFQSLYPSMIIAYNYCFSTLFGKIHSIATAAELNTSIINLGAIKYAVEKKTLHEVVNENKAHSSPLSSAFAQATYRQGVVPILLREVLGARIMIKTAMKNTKSQRLLRILDARQLALKLVANVTYGYTAANWSGRMPCVEVADAILAKGRETLERAIALVNSGDYCGARVIYGDTDSMFVLCEGSTLSEAFTIGERIASDVTSSNPAPVVLKLEKVYDGCVLETKKRYAGWMYETLNDTPRLDAKGIETVRRDTCPVVSKILEHSLQYIFKKDYGGLFSFLDRRLTLLPDIHFTEFLFCKEYRGDYEENSPVPQKKVAEYFKSLYPGYFPLHGERLPYAVVMGEPNSTVIACVVSLDEFLANDDLKINISYYIRAHILAALHRVTDLIPLKIEYLSESNSDCFNRICNSMGAQPWCQQCAVPNETYVSSTLRFAKEQRILENMRQVCCDCQQTRHIDIEACENGACGVNKVISSLMHSITPLAVKLHRKHRRQNDEADREANELAEETYVHRTRTHSDVLSEDEEESIGENRLDYSVYHFYKDNDDYRW